MFLDQNLTLVFPVRDLGSIPIYRLGASWILVREFNMWHDQIIQCKTSKIELSNMFLDRNLTQLCHERDLGGHLGFPSNLRYIEE